MKVKGNIFAACAFFRNNLPRGIGLTLVFDADDVAGNKFGECMDAGLLVYDKHAHPADLIRQLQSWTTKQLAKDKRLQICAFQNIYWLEQRGHLVTDEFNGVVFVRGEHGISVASLAEAIREPQAPR